jgi:4Fe-4S ferredoxin
MAKLPANVDCKQPPKIVTPVIDSHKCEGAGDCEEICPYGVFALRKLTKPELTSLPLVPWLKVLVHGGKQAFVVACPEKAIRLTRVAHQEQRP